MTWAKHDDGAPLHPKMLDAGPEACWLWYAGIAFANRAHTNGTIARRFLAALYPGHWTPERLDELAATLVKVRLWDELTDGTGWAIHNYNRYQEEATKEAVEVRRSYERERKAAQRAKKKPPKPVPDNVPDMSRGTTVGHVPGTTDGTGAGTASGTPEGTALTGVRAPDVSQPPDPTRPDPSRPVSPPGDTPPTPGEGVGAGEGGAPRAPTVERQGFRADAFAALLRERAKGRVLAAGADGRVLVQLQRAMDDAAKGGATAASYETLADWYAAGSQAWRTTRPLGLAELATKPGELSEHLERAAAWDAAGRPVIAHPSRTPATPAPRPSRVGPAAPSTFGARDYDAEREALIRDAEGSL